MHVRVEMFAVAGTPGTIMKVMMKIRMTIKVPNMTMTCNA